MSRFTISIPTIHLSPHSLITSISQHLSPFFHPHQDLSSICRSFSMTPYSQNALPYPASSSANRSTSFHTFLFESSNKFMIFKKQQLFPSTRIISASFSQTIAHHSLWLCEEDHNLLHDKSQLTQILHHFQYFPASFTIMDTHNPLIRLLLQNVEFSFNFFHNFLKLIFPHQLRYFSRRRLHQQ